MKRIELLEREVLVRLRSLATVPVKILFMFKLEFPDRVQQVPFYAVYVRLLQSTTHKTWPSYHALVPPHRFTISSDVYQEEKAERSSPWQFHFAKVQLLHGRGRCGAQDSAIRVDR